MHTFYKLAICGAIALTLITATNPVVADSYTNSHLEKKLELSLEVPITGYTTVANLTELEEAHNNAMSNSYLYSTNFQMIEGFELSGYHLFGKEIAKTDLQTGKVILEPDKIVERYLVHETAHLRYKANPIHKNMWEQHFSKEHYLNLKKLDTNKIFSSYTSAEEIPLLTEAVYLINQNSWHPVWNVEFKAGGIDAIRLKLSLLEELGYISASENMYAMTQLEYAESIQVNSK